MRNQRELRRWQSSSFDLFFIIFTGMMVNSKLNSSFYCVQRWIQYTSIYAVRSFNQSNVKYNRSERSALTAGHCLWFLSVSSWCHLRFSNDTKSYYEAWWQTSILVSSESSKYSVLEYSCLYSVFFFYLLDLGLDQFIVKRYDGKVRSLCLFCVVMRIEGQVNYH